MRDTYKFLEQKTGYDLEDAMVEVLEPYSTIAHSTEKEDRFEGTDLTVDGLRMDFTLNYKGKNYTQTVGAWRNWSIGIRTANGRVRFKNPVIVLGITVDPSHARQYIIPKLKTELGDINGLLNRISDLYWSWRDKHPEYDKYDT